LINIMAEFGKLGILFDMRGERSDRFNTG
jgi:hypothetical protein